MRFNPDFFNDDEDQPIDPFENKFKTLDTLDDLPDDAKDTFEELRERVVEMLDHERSVSKRDEIVTYLAFNQLQIQSIQREISNIHQMFLVLARAIDNK